jgi:glycerol-3-phosphate O-acyltransferase
MLRRSVDQFVNPYTFPSFHTRIQEPYNYYEFGQRYVRNLIDFDASVVGHLEIFDTIQAQLEAGENVVLLANHQTEADPAVLIRRVTLASIHNCIFPSM